MAKVLITSGPTREYLDPVRYLSNASSGRMGAALAEAFLARGHEVVVVSGPVRLAYPERAEVVSVVTTGDMLAAALRLFPECDGLVGAAAPCDYRPARFSSQKLSKRDGLLELALVETPDILARLSEIKQHRWIVGFALETEDLHNRAMEKLRRKRCDLMVTNEAAAIEAEETNLGVLAPDGTSLGRFSGSKSAVAVQLCRMIEDVLILPACGG